MTPGVCVKLDKKDVLPRTAHLVSYTTVNKFQAYPRDVATGGPPLNFAERPPDWRFRGGFLPFSVFRHIWSRLVKKLALIVALVPVAALAQSPIASSNFAGVENPLSENGAWVPMFSMSPDHTQFQKNNAAFMDRFDGTHGNHAVARTTAPVPNNQYSEIVVGHIGTQFSYVGVSVRIQTSGSALDSLYMYWGSLSGGSNNFLYQIVANGTSYGARSIVPHSALQDGDRIRLVARGPVLYGIKNGVREFIFNTGPDPVRYDTGTTGMLAYVPDNPVTNATIASWSTGPAPASSGIWASSNFAGVEDPLDEADRWFPLPGYQGFKKAGGFAVGKDGGHNISGVWSISPPARQYSEITLGTIASGAAGAVVRIDRNSPVPTGWLLFIYADNPPASGIYKIDPNANGGFAPIRTFTPDAILSGDKWRLTADGNTLQVSRNGVSQFTVTTDGSYPTGDVGIYTLTPAVTLMGWEGGDPGGPVKAPTISGFTPTTGPVGTSVTINGANLTGATAVAFNGVSATFSVTSDTAIQATVPTGATTGPVRVTTPGGTVTSTASFTVIPAPTITGFTPTSGPPGASVTISGSSFTGATAVAFNGVNATFTVSSDTSIQATVPASAATGPVSVTTSGGTATSSSSFTVLQPPTIASFTPTSGPQGTAVTINGTNLIGATAVAFNGVSASFTVASDTAIQTSVPAGATTGQLSVTTSGGTATSTAAFTVISAPTISSFTPTSGPPGASVTINGASFTGATAVSFNGVGATFTVSSDSVIQTSVPAGASTGPLNVTTSGGTATSASSFTVLKPPAIASFTPTSGLQGAAVTISGTNFTGASAVAFNGVSAAFTVASDTTIQTSVPAGATTGQLSVTTSGGTATSASSFTVLKPPTIASFTPTSGPQGTAVTISGTNFTGATAVAFNGVSASFTVASDAAIQTAVPAGATTGQLSVTTSGGTATSAGSFTVLKPPTITGFTPTSGLQGAAVTISGTNFTGATAVVFNGVSASFTVASDTAIQTAVPAGATTGPLRVTAPDGTATSASSFTVLKPPTITGFTPTSGLQGAAVTISGTNFTGATAVAFNGVSASFTVASDTAIQTAVPAGATTGPLSVTTSSGTATSAGSFTVLKPPAIASFTPASGPQGAAVTISGTNFTRATAVAFNGVSASFTVSSDTVIQTAVPVGATTGPLSVSTPDGTAQSSGAFTVIPPPAIASLSPANGPVGTTVTIGGSNLAGASAVTFNGVSASFTVISNTAISAVVPLGATTGPVRVTTPGGSAASANNFTVTAVLTVATAGNGQGTVSTSSDRPPIGVAYEVGTVVTLTATPAIGSDFTGWTGCDSVSGATCTVTMNAARSVTATFTLQTFPLSVSKSHLLLGDGTVTSTSSPGSPNQINCGSSCSVRFNYGTVVTLTATPALLSTFNGWSGCDSTSGNICTVTIGAARSVTASFLP